MVRALLRAELVKQEAKVTAARAELPWRVAALMIGFVVALAACGALVYVGLRMVGALN